MIIKYTTKRDTNGNRYTLEVDHTTREYKISYNSAWDYSDFITVTKRDRAKLIEALNAAQYTRVSF